RNDTLEQVFRRLNLSLNDLAAVRSLPDVKRALDVLKPGDAISLTHIDGALQALTRRLTNTELLTVTRKDDSFSSEVVNTPVDTRVTTAHGVVDSSLYVAARDAGLSADVIMRLANDIFGWDIDFALDIRRGDEFTLTYEQLYRDNNYLGDGRILAAEFINDHRLYRAVRYESADGKIANYFTPEGRSMRKQFLRSPVDFTRISSGFSLARLHPILNTIRAHKGIDYAAPTGTPIKASGDGKVDFAGTRGGYGNVIILDHGAGISTLYGHLSRFAGIRNGSRVNQGQIIGYVGHTGAATGPHLHYEYRINGIYKDPRTVPLPDASPIPMSYLAEFHQHTDAMLESLDRARQAAVSIVSAEGANHGK
ncbi:MAG TPA: peptidoglycan DD-metalloendopeptidase family protein, partial [Steroidobacteraceae bacterium]|nr:peptidoglycan DD-metalloendopeptidase family protein [Steroidobacteraceae bacterium]